MTRFATVTTGLVAALVAVSAPGLGRSLWGDEAFTATAVTRPLPRLLELLGAQDGGIAGYLVLMHAWTSLAGGSEAALRLPSLAATAVTVVATALLGRALAVRVLPAGGAEAAGLLAALLVAVHPQVAGTHALEARPYALATAGVVVAAACWRTGRAGPAAAGCLAAAFAVSQHFLAVTAVGCLLPWLLRAARGRVGVVLAAAGLAAVAAVMAVASAATYLQGWVPPPGPAEVALVVASLASPAGAAVLVGGALGVPWRRRPPGRDTWAVASAVAAWALGPVLALVAYGLVVTPALQVRYALSSAVAWQLGAALLAVAAVQRVLAGRCVRRPVAAGAAGGLALAVAAAGFAWVGLRAVRPVEDLRAAATEVLSGAVAGDAVVYQPAWREGTFRWYLSERPVAAGVPPPDPALEPGMSAVGAGSLWTPVRAAVAGRPAEALAPYRRVWVLGDPGVHDGWEPVPETGDALHDALAAGWTRAARSEHAGVSVELWVRPDPGGAR